MKPENQLRWEENCTDNLEVEEKKINLTNELIKDKRLKLKKEQNWTKSNTQSNH